MSLVVQDLSKKYGTRTVVDHLSFEMNRPGVYALLGTNGAGKTTSIRMILGMLSRDSGTVTWNGKPLDINTCNVGYLAEERGLYPKYTIMDQLMYFAALRGVSASEAKKRIHYWAERFDIIEYLYPQEYADIQAKKARMHEEASPKKKGLFGSSNQRKKRIAPKTADQLSKGNQQKIQMIAALISDPELLILDEPLSGLDPVNTDLFKDIIHEQINKGKYLIMSPAVRLSIPSSAAAMSPASPCTYIPMRQASFWLYPLARSAVIMPVSTSPLPAVAIPALPVELKATVPSGMQRAE